jgi:double-GTPase-like protein
MAFIYLGLLVFGVIVVVAVGAFVISFVVYALGLVFLGSAAIGLVFGTYKFIVASWDGFDPHGPVGHLRIEPPQQAEADPAYRSYYAGPVLRDYRKVLAQTYREMWTTLVGDIDQKKKRNNVPESWAARVWGWAKDSFLYPAIKYPAAILVILGLFFGAMAASAFVAVASLVFALLLVLLVLVAVGTGGGWRILEVATLWVRGITIECNTCHERATRPIYRCPDCRSEHRRLLPGMAGVMHRTCRCQTVLPTLLMNGKAKLAAQCAACKSQLPVHGLTAPTVHIPVIAGPTAGKSVFMQTAISRLMLNVDGFEFADERAKQEFERNLKLGVLDDPRRAVKTAVTRPRAYNVYVGAEGSRARRLLYLYDPAGEIPESADQLAESQFLKHTKGVVFIVDPFSLRQVRADTDRSLLGRVGASNTAPKESMERFTEALREHLRTKSSERIKIPVAVVLTKADGLLESSGPSHPYAGHLLASRAEHDAAVRDWLTEMGQRDLLSSMDNQFATVGYFVVSYQDARDVMGHRSAAGDVVNDDPANPLLWLLDRKAVR